MDRRVLPAILMGFLLISSITAFVPVSKVYASSGSLTGRIFDEGIDKDDNGLFDFLQIAMEVNITYGGIFTVSISGLKNATDMPYSYVSVYDSITSNLDAGVQNVTLSLYGPTIRASGQTNLTLVDYVSMSSDSYASNQNVPLSKPYSYLEFDAASTDMEASFKVFPNGTVDMGGTLNSPRMTYPAKGLNVSASVDISPDDNRTTVSASENLTLPKWAVSLWPYNASTVSALAQYSQQTGLLNFGLNGTLTLLPGNSYPYYQFLNLPPPPYLYGSQYPWNTSDFTLNLAYANGIANGELDASTILPTSATSAFPFPINATDLTINADYSEGLMKGNITFHILPSFPVGDLNLDFESTRTQTTATGSITIIYGEYPSGPYNSIIVNDTYVDTIIENITALEGTGPNSLFNTTRGLMELSNTTSITKTPLESVGATVDFDIILHGDLIAYIAGMMSISSTDNVTYPGVYRLLNVTATSATSASLHLSYQHGPQTAILHLNFVDSFEQLVTDLFTFPPDTTPLVVASYSMRPTLEIGDIALVRNITDASEINAAPYPDGDIIAFYSPNNPKEIILHRAINSTFWNGTWYFQTKGDYNYSPDFWAANDTYDGMISERLVFGKVVERIPWLGNLFPQQFIYAFGPNPQIQFKDIPTLIEDFVSSAKTFNLNLTYTSATQTFDLKSNLAFDVLGYRDKTIPRLPDLVDPSMKTYVEDLFDNIYAEITSGEVQFTYQDGQEKLQASFEIQGDFSRELNHIKNIYISEIANQTPFALPEPFLSINATWLDTNDLKLTCTVIEETAFFKFEGFRASPSIDPINETSFNLYRFFNLTAPTASYVTEMPRSGEKLKLTVQGMSNGTHIPALFAPQSMPAPDYVSDDQTLMSWNNLSISTLKDLTFSLQYCTSFTYDGQTYPVITKSNGSVSPVTFDPPGKRISMTIDGPSGTEGYANISIPKDLINAPFDQWFIVVGSQTIVYPDYQVNETSTHTFLYFNFTFSSPVTIQITGTEALSEFTTIQILPMLILATLIIVIGGKIVKIRRRPKENDELTL